MMFCPKCSAILLPKTEKGKKILECSCGYKKKKVDSFGIKEVMKEETKMEAVNEGDTDKTKPVADDVECPKCKHTKAYYWLIQTRSADEPATKFLKCLECKHTWRDYN
ncbi:transcription factor S [archaeon]|jgi:transcription factor S|nr:transcription factor S [archaeon]MBT4351168.1 transcription factor S [archaeon]MBT4648291.1 transcription factor S [archaeon]MBT6821547.1 transcription factor S [archaeon]MBT7391942.1 transcription factor S [archaeon]